MDQLRLDCPEFLDYLEYLEVQLRLDCPEFPDYPEFLEVQLRLDYLEILEAQLDQSVQYYL